MRKDYKSTYVFIALLLLIIYLSALVIWPYLGFIILAVVIAYTTHPLYRSFHKRMNKQLSAAIMVLLVFILLLIPSVFLISSLVKQGTNTLSNTDGLLEYAAIISSNLNIDVDPSFVITMITSRARDYLLSQSLTFLTSLVDIIIGITILFFLLFYLFRDGRKIYQTIVETLPLKEAYKHVLFEEMQIVTNAVIYGQLVIALLQGTIGGLLFTLFGINNPVFWGFMIAILSFLPVVGPPMILIPAGIIQLLGQHYFAGITIITVSIILLTNVDSVVKPLIISERSRLNPALILIGVIGGIKAFGFMGFIIGPLVLALLLALLNVYRQDFKPSAELTRARKEKDQLIIRLHERPPDEHRVP